MDKRWIVYLPSFFSFFIPNLLWVARSKLSQPAGVTHSLDSAYPHEYYYPNQWGMKPSLDTLFIVQMTNQKQGQQGQLGQHFSLSRPRTCADESIESTVLAVPH